VYLCLPALVGPQCLEELADDVLEGDVILLQALEVVTLCSRRAEGQSEVWVEIPQTEGDLCVCFLCVSVCALCVFSYVALQ
jgi:hypothetical protein